ncbi:hypothetical protein B0T22DRAFT_445262 [Podospora appendiculata]|uniref:Uncharacterized protein n=1 Tax=Podospora appendiculata TaxID=314037 RepID=A0AAE0WZT9_9PEZI|nr:hypothetical protein B0T22DRAFT_445262 [Podospora appendiculata]
MPHLKPYPRDSSIYESSSSAANEGRECRVDGCSHKHCYARVGGQKVYSRFCIFHRCQKMLPTEQGYHCPFAKDERDSFCRNHMRCGDYNCLERGEYESEARNLPWFCKAHRCREEGCTSKITNLIHKCCDNHVKCAAPNCPSAPDASQSSSLCARHTCTAPTCPNQASLETNRCSEHAVRVPRRTCKAPNCDKTPRRRGDGSGGFEDECDDHRSSSKCIFAGCGRFRREAGAVPYCHEHGCRVPLCREVRDAPGSIYCFSHRCTMDGCPAYIPSPPPGVAPSSIPVFCHNHACHTPKCPRSRLSLSSLCQDHICARADVKCTREGADGVGSFCAVHECGESGCHNEARFENGFCEERHACVAAGCPRGRIVVRDGEGEGEVPERCLRHERVFWKAEGRREAEEELRTVKEEEQQQQQQRRGREAARRRAESRGSGPARGAAWNGNGGGEGGWYYRGDAHE